MCQNLEGLHNQHFPNNQGMMLQNHAWVKDTFKVQIWLMNFNVTEHEKLIDMVSYSTYQETTTLWLLVLYKRRTFTII